MNTQIRSMIDEGGGGSHRDDLHPWPETSSEWKPVSLSSLRRVERRKLASIVSEGNLTVVIAAGAGVVVLLLICCCVFRRRNPRNVAIPPSRQENLQIVVESDRKISTSSSAPYNRSRTPNRKLSRGNSRSDSRSRSRPPRGALSSTRSRKAGRDDARKRRRKKERDRKDKSDKKFKNRSKVSSIGQTASTASNTITGRIPDDEEFRDSNSLNMEDNLDEEVSRKEKSRRKRRDKDSRSERSERIASREKERREKEKRVRKRDVIEEVEEDDPEIGLTGEYSRLREDWFQFERNKNAEKDEERRIRGGKTAEESEEEREWKREREKKKKMKKAMKKEERRKLRENETEEERRERNRRKKQKKKEKRNKKKEKEKEGALGAIGKTDISLELIQEYEADEDYPMSEKESMKSFRQKPKLDKSDDEISPKEKQRESSIPPYQALGFDSDSNDSYANYKSTNSRITKAESEVKSDREMDEPKEKSSGDNLTPPPSPMPIGFASPPTTPITTVKTINTGKQQEEERKRRQQEEEEIATKMAVKPKPGIGMLMKAKGVFALSKSTFGRKQKTALDAEEAKLLGSSSNIPIVTSNGIEIDGENIAVMEKENSYDVFTIEAPPVTPPMQDYNVRPPMIPGTPKVMEQKKETTERDQERFISPTVAKSQKRKSTGNFRMENPFVEEKSPPSPKLEQKPSSRSNRPKLQPEYVSEPEDIPEPEPMETPVRVKEGGKKSRKVSKNESEEVKSTTSSLRSRLERARSLVSDTVRSRNSSDNNRSRATSLYSGSIPSRARSDFSGSARSGRSSQSYNNGSGSSFSGSIYDDDEGSIYDSESVYDDDGSVYDDSGSEYSRSSRGSSYYGSEYSNGSPRSSVGSERYSEYSDDSRRSREVAV